MNGKALERDLRTHSNKKYHNAWIDVVVSDQSITYRKGILHLTILISVGPDKPLRIYPSQVTINIIFPLEKNNQNELSVCFVKVHKSNSWVSLTTPTIMKTLLDWKRRSVRVEEDPSPNRANRATKDQERRSTKPMNLLRQKGAKEPLQTSLTPPMDTTEIVVLPSLKS